jgi:hypothetical protein
MDSTRIEKAILASVVVYWRKVALVVSMAAERLGPEFSAKDDAYSIVAKHIPALVRDGRLISQGDLNLWRFSEVRRPRQMRITLQSRLRRVQ